MAIDRTAKEGRDRILEVLRPYASNWTGTLGRGDLVIPQREIARVIQQILETLADLGDRCAEVSDMELFQVLNEARRLPSLQDQAQRLRTAFLMLKR